MDQQQFLEALALHGVDVQEAVDRFMGNQALFLSFICRLPDAMKLDAIETALEAEDQDGFYEQLHSLKGMAANLSAVSLAGPAQKMLELYRASGLRERARLESLLGQLQTAGKELTDLIGEYQSTKGGAE